MTAKNSSTQPGDGTQRGFDAAAEDIVSGLAIIELVQASLRHREGCGAAESALGGAITLLMSAQESLIELRGT